MTDDSVFQRIMKKKLSLLGLKYPLHSLLYLKRRPHGLRNIVSRRRETQKWDMNRKERKGGGAFLCAHSARRKKRTLRVTSFSRTPVEAITSSDRK